MMQGFIYTEGNKPVIPVFVIGTDISPYFYLQISSIEIIKGLMSSRNKTNSKHVIAVHYLVFGTMHRKGM